MSKAGVKECLPSDPSSTETLNKPAIVIISRTGAKEDHSMTGSSTSSTQSGKGSSVRDKGYRRPKNAGRYQERRDASVRDSEHPKFTNGESKSRTHNQRSRGYNPRWREHQDGARRSPRQGRPPKQNGGTGQKNKIVGDLNQEQITSGSKSVELDQKEIRLTEIHRKPQTSTPATLAVFSKDDINCVPMSSEQTQSVTVATKSSKPQSRYNGSGYRSNKLPQRSMDNDFSSTKYREYQADPERQCSDFTRSK